MRRWVLYWALAGILIPEALFLDTMIREGIGPTDYLLPFLWPSSILLMITECADCRGWSVFGVVVLLVAAAINVILYTILGVISWPIARSFLRWR